MEPRTLQQVAQMVEGTLHGNSGVTFLSKVETDSRRLKAGDFFVALQGELFDGHDFLSRVHEARAAGALVNRFYPELSDLPQIEVKDTLLGLQRLARKYRSELDLEVVAVTGSNGKTSTKEMIFSVLYERFQVTKTIGNLNNHIGLPLTILQANAQDQVGVFEMGMNHAGELAPLVEIAQPRVGVITNIGITHIGNLGSREAIAAEKAVVAESIPKDGAVILNEHDEFSNWIAQRSVARVIRAGINAGDVQARDIQRDERGERFTLVHRFDRAPVNLPVFGVHMVVNACLAAAVGLEFGLTLEQCATGLGKTAIPGNRLRLQKLGSLLILNDAYNANPDSMIAALITAQGFPVTGRRVAALGSMGELGHESEAGHARVGKRVAEMDFDLLITVGSEAGVIAEAARRQGMSSVQSLATHGEAIDALNDFLEPGDLLVLKGSRSAEMERVAVGLEASMDDAKWRSP